MAMSRNCLERLDDGSKRRARSAATMSRTPPTAMRMQFSLTEMVKMDLPTLREGSMRRRSRGCSGGGTQLGCQDHNVRRARSSRGWAGGVLRQGRRRGRGNNTGGAAVKRGDCNRGLEGLRAAHPRRSAGQWEIRALLRKGWECSTSMW